MPAGPSTVPVVLFWPWGEGDPATATLRALRANIPADTQVVVLDRARGFAAAVNSAAQGSGKADLALVADACKLPEGWLDRVRAAAYVDDTVAAATALACGPSAPLYRGFDDDPVLGPPAPGDPEPGSGGRDQARFPPVRPRVFRLWPHCAYLRRTAFDVIGPFDESLSHPASALDEFSARAVSRGLSAALADDVVARSLPGGLAPCPGHELDRVARRHPWAGAARAEEDALELGPLRRSLVAARVHSHATLSVTIDARALGPMTAGTQTYVAGLILALARSGQAAVRAVVRDGVPEVVIQAFENAGVEVVLEARALEGLPRTDIAHRPQQAFVPEDLRLLRRIGERVLITHLDLIGYRNPSYHASSDEWRRYRRLTRVALGAADCVLFPSEHARRDAVAEDLIEPMWTALAGVGVEPAAAEEPRTQPSAVPSGRELLVLIGADYLHKNRLFALDLVDQLRRRHDWRGVLVLAGAHVEHGGSADAEAELLRARPELAKHVIDLGPVKESEKRWLLERAQAVLCASTYEGFGLTPLEAAAAGTPCIYGAQTSLGEVVGEDPATIVPWDAAASADRAFPLLQHGEERERHLRALGEALHRHDWGSIAERLCEVYRKAIESPYRSSVPRAWEELLVREQLIIDLDRRYQELRERVAYGLALIDRDGLLTRQQQRGLMRIASRGWLRGPLLGPASLIGGMRSDDPAASSR